jgi:hypothetical protein
LTVRKIGCLWIFREGREKGVDLPGDRVVEVSGKGWRWNAGWEGTPVLNVVPDPAGRGSSAASSLIDEIVREGARRMLAEALQAEVGAYIAGLAGERDENGRRLVVRDGYHEPREVPTSAGAVEVTVPRVNDKRAGAQTGEAMRFFPAILPPWAGKTPRVTGVLPAVPAWLAGRGLRARAGAVPGIGGGAVPAR